ncbi:Putative 2-hydroxyacid dehydrogenase [Pirellula sp. SH-Sr6A]|uniref:D-2-hydroxyacid dehydrogenase n=1 Tax=Pirellula sp. SH-Sr6A TaxID=1632865 RepID=UPI00078D882F|nr:D-2-hydroxyacid dehydrogenase [Pirellula sp. SH-Sr6A]AMV33124.1 Putative 2-hydroxyacid dehydrogenase [Pirellula sp. SH-Sr6A]
MSMHPTRSTTIWTNASFPAPVEKFLRDALGSHRLIVANQTSSSNLVGSPADPALAEAQIAFGQPDAQQLLQLPQIRWVHLTSAGYTAYDREDLREAFRARNASLTTSSGVYDEPCAEHVFSMMMSLARQLPACLDEQRTNRAWSAAPIRRNSFLLRGQKAILFGYGEIAKRLVELLAPFEMEIVGVRRKPKGNESIPILSHEQADKWLGNADHVINILPANPSTQGYFDRNRLARLSPGAIFYNIGRGNTVDQEALVDLLNGSHLAAAYLDVTTPEPLPAEHPLWTARNCFITPHSAGGFREEMEGLVRHFLENLARFEQNEPLKNRVI